MKSSIDSLVAFNENEILFDLPGAIELLNREALSGGKLFRPRLLFLIAKSLGVAQELAAPYAKVAERIHNATLLHDDVIDESLIRRGRKTINASGHNRKAVLAGDLLLTTSLREIGKHSNIKILNDTFDVLVELVEGEWLQLEARNSVQIDERHLRRVAEKKTASLIAWCFTTCGRLAEFDDTTIDVMSKAGKHLGIAFQMADDCLDFSYSSGKPWAQDLREGQINYVTLTIMESYPNLKKELFQWIEHGLEPEMSPEFKSGITEAIAIVNRQIQTEIESFRYLLNRNQALRPVLKSLESKVIIPFFNGDHL